MDFTLDIATPDDDRDIRALLARNPVPGRVTLTYEREPSYFEGCRLAGDDYQVLVARESSTGRLAGVACQSVRRMYVNGRVERVGYLGQLRVDPDFRGRWLVSRGFQRLRELGANRGARLHIATITDESTTARDLLVGSPRAHFPRFEPYAGLRTLALPRRAGARRRASEIRVSVAGAGDLDDVLTFVNDVGRTRQFFPVVGRRDVGDDEVSDRTLLVARRGTHTVGALLVWDQSACKQVVVRGYSGGLRRLRPVVNTGLWMRGLPRLPAVGAQVRHAFAAFVSVADGDVGAFVALVESSRHLAHERGIDFVTLGLAERDPFLAHVRGRAAVEYRSTLYVVDWNPTGDGHGLDDRTVGIEIALL